MHILQERALTANSTDIWFDNSTVRLFKKYKINKESWHIRDKKSEQQNQYL